MNRQAIYAGCLTGVALVAILFYPNYVVFWQAGSQSLGLILSIVAAVLSVAGGVLAARWAGVVTRREGAKLGALAGRIAGTFAALEVTAASVMEPDSFLRRGVRSASDPEQRIFILVIAVVQIAIFACIALGGMLLSGTLLGALGGWLAPPSTREEEIEDRG